MPPFALGCQRILTRSTLMLSLLAGCGAQRSGSDIEGAASDPGRIPFEAIALPANGTAGADAQAVARTLYGSTAPAEGSYTEEAVILSDAGSEKVLLFSQTGLADDSVRGMRYRLEFTQQDGQWQLTWAGRQITCWPGRGHEDWGTAPCR